MKPRIKGFTLWFTGLPSSGKTTLSDALAQELRQRGHEVQCLDGDFVRKELSRDLGFSPEDRKKNIERVAAKAAEFNQSGAVAIVSLISPYRSARDSARRGIERFIEVFVDCPLEVCEKRDVKGMYRLAREGRLKDFTGVSAPYEPPVVPEIALRTDKLSVKECTQRVLDLLEKKGWLG